MAEAIRIMNQALGIADVMTEALATGLFVSLCTISALPTPITLGPSGSPDAAYVAVPALTGIRCMIAVLYPMRSPESAERKARETQMTENDWHVLLEANYPTIDTSMRATVDGILYDITNVDQDSQSQMTRLQCRLVTM